MECPFPRRMEPALMYVLETAYVYYLVLRLRKGLPRFLALLPLLPLSHLVTWRAPTPVERIICCVVFLWYFLFKLLLLAWDKGGLAATNASALTSFPRFLLANLSTYRLHHGPDFSCRKEEAVLRRRDSKSEEVLLSNGHVKSFSHSKQELDFRRRHAESEEIVLSNGHEISFSHSKQEVDLRRRDSDSEEVVLSNGHEKSFSHSKQEVDLRRMDSVSEEIVSFNGLEKPGAAAAEKESWLWRTATSQAMHEVLIRDLVFYIFTMSLLWVLLTGKETMSSYIVDLSIGSLVYFLISLLFDTVVVIPGSIIGKEVEPVMDMPFLSTSLAEFWGRRWNLVVINLGRVSVYEPTLQFLSRGKKRASLVDRAISTQAVFLVSGLMHELALFYAMKTRPSWEMTTFFVVNGLGTLVERLVMRKMRHSRFELPKFLGRAYTLAFLYFTGHWFFCPPIRAGLLDGVNILYAASRWPLLAKPFGL